MINWLFSFLLISFFMVTAAFGGVVDYVKKSGIQGGIIVHLECGNGQETVQLKINDNLTVQGLDSDQRDINAARKYIKSKGLYGKVSANVFDGKKLPYADNLINIVVADSAGSVSKDEIMRVLVPLGTAYIGGEKFTKPWPKELDEWGHFLHSPDNNAVGKDKKSGMPRVLQWVDGKKWARSHEEFSTISVAVSSGGKIFYIVDKSPNAYISFNPTWTLVARDAFNGLLLWERKIPKWNDHMRQFRSGPAHLPRRLVAIDGKVYVTLGLAAPLSQLDANTGKTLKTYEGTEWCEEVLVKDGKLYMLVGSSEENRFGTGLYQKGEPSRNTDRFLAVIDAKSGKELWRKNAKDKEFILPLGIALSDGKLFYHSIKGLGCLDSSTGKQQWFVERKTAGKRYGFATSTLVATPKVVILADRDLKNKKNFDGTIATTDITWGIGGWNQKNCGSRVGQSIATAYSTIDGKKLWEAKCAEGYNAPVDVFVVNNLVWLGPFNKWVKKTNGYDLLTGAVKHTINLEAPNVGMAHNRCYRNKATENFLFTNRDGIELHDYKKGWIRNNSWTRGPCQFGILPCNGLIYAPTDPCACHLKMRMPGFKAYSSQRMNSVGKPVKDDNRLTKGPAYTKLKQLASISLKASDWPMHRNNISRSGSTKTKITLVKDSPKWSTKLGGSLTQPVSAHGRVYVASKDEYTVYALDASTGKVIWDFVAGSTIDSAPTIYKGMIIFGSGDGDVYCLDAATGNLGWRFIAAPEDRLIQAFGHIESSWPVHGSVIVKNDELFFTAGRSSYLGGGIYFYRLNPVTGKIIKSNVITYIDPKTEKQTGRKEEGFDSDGVLSDILSSDGDKLFLKHLEIDDNGNYKDATVPHLFSPTSLLDEEWFVRSYWTYAPTITGAGWGGWANAANTNPAGRVLAFTDDTIYGYGRINVKAGPVGHKSNTYHLYSSIKKYKPEKPAPLKAKSTKKKRKPKAKVNKTYHWSQDAPFTVRAMVATPDQLIVAGVPFKGKRPQPIDPSKYPEKYKEHSGENFRLEFENPKEALDAFKGKLGSYIRLVSTESGEKTKEIKLDGVPVNDGMSVANGNILISLKNGKVVCFAK